MHLYILYDYVVVIIIDPCDGWNLPIPIYDLYEQWERAVWSFTYSIVFEELEHAC